MKKKKWNRALAVLFVMMTAVTLLSGCGSKSAETVRSDAGEMRSVLQRKYR